MRLVERMTQHPPTCLHCGAGNTDNDEFPIPHLDLEREVNWGDSTYICGSCVMKICALAGYIAPDQYQELEMTISSLRHEKHDLKSRLEQKERRLTSIAEGRTALRDERRERRSA